MLNAELKPTDPFMVAFALSIEAVVSIEVLDACWLKLGRPAAAGRVRAGPAITRDGRRWMRGAFAVFCFTTISYFTATGRTLRISSFNDSEFTIREPGDLSITVQSYRQLY